MTASPELSCVVIARNEENYIEDCISPLVEIKCAGIINEIILVDSNSTDSTIDIVSNFDIKIYKIIEDPYCTPSAGRYVGRQVAEYGDILFIDGDMEVKPEWVEMAYKYLIENPGVGGVSGHLNDVPEEVDDNKIVSHFGGIALYREEALEDVGGFNPNFKAFEDIDIGYRMDISGWDLVKLPIIAATHPDRLSKSMIIRKWKGGYYNGSGQVLRESISNPRLFIRHVQRLKISVFMGSWSILGITIISIKKVPIWAYIILSSLSLIFLSKKIGVKKTVIILLKQPCLVVGTLAGFIKHDKSCFNIESVDRIQ